MRLERTVVVFFLLQFCNILSMIGTSLITPFFPPFALEKGIHTNLLGFIISANPVGAFLSSIALGKLMNEVWFANYHKKNRFGFIIVGMALQGIGLYLFVTMNWIEESLIIILLATFGRFISGIGTSFFMTPFYAYIPIMYPHEVERRIAISELISGGAQLVGPVFGSLLFSAGGFIMPFVAFGAVDLLLVPILIKTLLGKKIIPVDNINRSSTITTRRGQDSLLGEMTQLEPLTYWRIFKKYPVLMQSLMVFACNVCFTYFQPIIAEFYKIQFDIEASTVGYLMTIVTAGYAIGSYGMGQVKQRKRLMVCIGCAFLGVSYLFVGPYKLLTHLDSILALTLVSQGLMGFSAALVYIPSVPLLNEFLAAYYPHRGVQTANISSAIFTAGMALGQLTGPIVSGLLSQDYGFQTSCAMLGLSLLGLCILYLPVLFFKLPKNIEECFDSIFSNEISVIRVIDSHNIVT